VGFLFDDYDTLKSKECLKFLLATIKLYGTKIVISKSIELKQLCPQNEFEQKKNWD
jgi:hypothetical protein